MLTVQTGGTLNDSFAVIGNLPGGQGTVTVTGAGSNWSTAGSVVVGGQGAGILTIQDGGTMSSAGGSIGLSAGSNGAVKVTDPGSSWNNGPSGGLNIGSLGTGILTIANGGTVINNTILTVANIGNGPASQGSVTVTGAGSTWSNPFGVNIGNSGTGTLTIADGGTVSGPIVIAANASAIGTLNVGAGAGNPAAAPGTVTASSLAFGAGTGTLNFNHTSAGYVFAPAISGNGTVNVLAGTTILIADSTYTGGTTISAGTLQLGNGGSTGSIVGNVADNGALAFDHNNVFTVSGVISGTGGLAQVGSGITVLTADNSYTGPTAVNGGILQAGVAVSAFGSNSAVTINAGTLALNNYNETIGSLTGASGAAVTLGSGTLSAGVDNTSTAYAGTIIGTGGLNKDGAGTLTLTGSNTYSGGTTISAGTLQLGNGGSTGSIVGNVVDNGSLAFDRVDTLSFPGIITGTGSVIQAGAGTTILNANNPYTGGTTIAAGTLVIGDPANPSAALSGGGPITVASGATLGGYGSVTGSVTNSGTIAAGNATPGFGTSPASTFTIIGNLFNQGTVNLASDPIVGNVLAVQGNYVGAGGALNFNTVLASDNSPSDKLVISGGTGTGNTLVHVSNAGGSGAETQGNGILIVQAINGGTTAPGAFMLSSGELRAGAFDYDLFRGGVSGSPNDWFLRSDFVVPPVVPPVMPPVVPPVSVLPPTPPGPLPPLPPFPTDPPPAPLPPGVYPIIGPELATDGVVQPIARQLALTMLGTLHERIGDTLTDESAGPDAEGWGHSGWARFFGQQIDNRYQSFADPSTAGRLFGVQAGFDIWRGSFLPGHRDATGLYFAYGNAAMDVDGLVTNTAATTYVHSRTGTVNLDAYSGGAYWTHYGPGGWYLDAVVQGTAYTGNATTQFANLPTTGSGIITSLEAGYPIPLPLGPRFVLEPQGQILWQHVSFTQANDGLGAVALGSTSGATGRLGVRGQWSIVTGDGQVWQPYVRANLWQNWGGEATTTFAGTDQVPLLQESTQLEFAAGVTTRLSTCMSLYAQAGYEFAVGGTDGGRRQGIKGDFGLRLTFGNPPPPPALAVVPAAAVARSYLVFFDWDKATLTDRARQIIREAADHSTKVPYTRIEVNGYTDTSGTARYNQGLSVRRAQAVAAELVRDGVPAAAVTIRGFGDTNLLVPTGPGVREPQNRRVEIVLQ